MEQTRIIELVASLLGHAPEDVSALSNRWYSTPDGLIFVSFGPDLSEEYDEWFHKNWHTFDAEFLATYLPLNTDTIRAIQTQVYLRDCCEDFFNLFIETRPECREQIRADRLKSCGLSGLTTPFSSLKLLTDTVIDGTPFAIFVKE